ncbi:MAG: 7-carboxy-7-deazaguanine synthase QueE [Verrucomicrobiota bacterium JB023]|nr:7-carboxy-7-deazaguanine synthase QueE [Verrucomicrobiota bacterium JB023]
MKVVRQADGSPEIFATLQGEGPSIGSPAVFLRLSLCNLHCQWCDTPYTWNWKGTPWSHDSVKKYDKHLEIIELEPPSLSDLLKRLDLPRLIITGGEPLLQDAAIVDLLAHLGGHFPFIEIETNGTRRPSPALAEQVTQFNVSPKLSNSGNDASLRLNREVLSWFGTAPSAFFKFVVADPRDLDEVKSLIADYGIPSSKVILMPEGRSSSILHERARWLAPLCQQNGFRLGDRLHVHLWGDERGR